MCAIDHSDTAAETCKHGLLWGARYRKLTNIYTCWSFSFPMLPPPISHSDERLCPRSCPASAYCLPSTCFVYFIFVEICWIVSWERNHSGDVRWASSGHLTPKTRQQCCMLLQSFALQDRSGTLLSRERLPAEEPRLQLASLALSESAYPTLNSQRREKFGHLL
jgi:hypothetical protein